MLQPLMGADGWEIHPLTAYPISLRRNGAHERPVVGGECDSAPVATADDIRELVRDLPRAYEALVRDRVKWRVGRLVFAALSRDETVLGFAFPRDERNGALSSEPHLFLPPAPADERYQWLQARMEALDACRLEELIVDAWAMCVPNSVAAQYFAAHPLVSARDPSPLGGPGPAC
jgi:hypothetical protein